MTPAEELATKLHRAAKPPLTNRLREFRLNRGLRLNEVSKTLGIAIGTLATYETSRCSPSLPVALRLAAFYGETIETIWKVYEVDAGKGI